MWAEVQPRRYRYTLTPDVLVRAVMSAFVLRLSGLRDMARFQARLLGTANFSSLSHALSRDISLRYVRHLVESLEGWHRPGRDELVALDSMPLTLAKSLRHRCVKVNRNTVGGGVLWSYALGRDGAVARSRYIRSWPERGMTQRSWSTSSCSATARFT